MVVDAAHPMMHSLTIEHSYTDSKSTAEHSIIIFPAFQPIFHISARIPNIPQLPFFLSIYTIHRSDPKYRVIIAPTLTLFTTTCCTNHHADFSFNLLIRYCSPNILTMPQIGYSMLYNQPIIFLDKTPTIVYDWLLISTYCKPACTDYKVPLA